MKIFSQAIATGKEWKPCRGCGRVFEHGEVISSVSDDSGFNVTSWYCHECIDGYFMTDLYYNERKCLDNRVDWAYTHRRLDRIIELEKSFCVGKVIENERAGNR